MPRETMGFALGLDLLFRHTVWSRGGSNWVNKVFKETYGPETDIILDMRNGQIIERCGVPRVTDDAVCRKNRTSKGFGSYHCNALCGGNTYLAFSRTRLIAGNPGNISGHSSTRLRMFTNCVLILG